MFISEPGRTAYDISFNIFGFPVRVHPGFFLLPLIMSNGFMSLFNPGMVLLIFAGVFFISILVHELGHSVALRYFGVPSRIVLYWFGGLAIHENHWGSRSQLTHNQQIIVSLAGPFAGFILAALTIGVVFALNGTLEYSQNGIFPMWAPNLGETAVAGNKAIFLLIFIMLFCNIVWGVLNLLPVLPLDGGQVCREICLKLDANNGLKNALMISVGAGVLIALIGFMNRDSFVGILFAILAFSSFQTLQQMSFRGGGRW